MCRSIEEGGRRCNGRSCGAASARLRQQRSRARRGLEAARTGGDPDAIAAAEAKYTAVTGGQPPAADAGVFAGELPAQPPKDKPVPAPEPQDVAPAESTEDRIRDVVAELTAQGNDWAGIVDIRRALPDVPHDEISRALLDMERSSDNVHLAPESNRKALAGEDHDAAVTIGGEQQHVVMIEPPRDDEAFGRVQAAGLTNAADADLEAARRNISTPPSDYDAIRVEQKRREQDDVTSPPPASPAAAAGSTEDRIRAAARSLGRAGSWVRLTDLRRAVGDDVSHEEVTRVLLEMQRTDEDVVLAPDSDRRSLRQEDHDAAIRVGKEHAHMVVIQHPSIPGEAVRIRDAGLGNATDEQLEIARHDPDITSALYDEIRAEEKRRGQ